MTTIKKDIAQERMKGLIKEKKMISKKLTTILDSSRFCNRKIDFLNIDLEGADLSALQSLDFKIYRPKIICVEIIDKIFENSNIFKFLKKLNYKKKWSSITNINHIFVDELFSKELE